MMNEEEEDEYNYKPCDDEQRDLEENGFR